MCNMSDSNFTQIENSDLQKLLLTLTLLAAA